MPAHLTKKQEAFVTAYIKTGSATKAYRSIYKPKGKAAGIYVEASKLRKHPKIALRIEELRAPALEAAKIDIDTWAKEAARYALAQPSIGLKHADKRGYLDMLGRHVGAYEKDNIQSRDSLVLNVEQARPVKR